MQKRLGLLKDYIKVKRAGSEETTFGGDQNFFAAAQRVKELVQKEDGSDNASKQQEAPNRFQAEQQSTESEKSRAEDEKKQKMGCGIVALSDIFLYLSGKYNKSLQLDESSYVNCELDQKTYCEYYNRIYRFAGGVSLKNGASGIKLWRKFNRMAKLQGWKERARWGFSRKKMFGRMEEMLKKDIPVILCVPMALFKKDKEKGLWFYTKNEKGDYIPRTRVNGHYVVVTELFFEQEEIYLVISSWGKQYFIKWKEYEEQIRSRLFGAFLGNLLYIK
ncbi:MAG: hypothetical protein IJ409_00410 [Lachnospiraceae bacterium]|nr:hypothetical protein [Lachnospiraceae bacterium]